MNKGEPKILPKVLFVEDEEGWHMFWQYQLGDRLTYIKALSIEEAEEQFFANSDIDAIVIDACVPGGCINTLPLVRKLKEVFAGPIIGVAVYRGYRSKLLRAGCNHECQKTLLSRKLAEILGLQLQAS